MCKNFVLYGLILTEAFNRSVIMLESGSTFALQHPMATLKCFGYGMSFSTPDCPLITGHSVGFYKDKKVIPRNYFPKRNHKIFEIGSGLAEFIPWVIRTSGGSIGQLPVVVDPLNYDVVVELLELALKRGLDEGLAKVATELMNRANIYRDPTKVTLINVRLEDSLDLPQLRDKYDFVLDSCAGFYSGLSYTQLEAIKKTLKKNSFFHS